MKNPQVILHIESIEEIAERLVKEERITEEMKENFIELIRLTKSRKYTLLADCLWEAKNDFGRAADIYYLNKSD